jgi:hypothetical protein
MTAPRSQSPAHSSVTYRLLHQVETAFAYLVLKSWVVTMCTIYFKKRKALRFPTARSYDYDCPISNKQLFLVMARQCVSFEGGKGMAKLSL